MLALPALLLNLVPLRRALVSRPLFAVYRTMTPTLSETEKVALEAGTVGWEGELFSGKPDWSKLNGRPAPKLSAEEQAFLDGPVEEVCRMTNDWETTHVRADLAPEGWAFVKKHKFFGMIIPKEYGGLGFSALGHHKVIQKLASISSVLSSGR